MSRQVTTVLLSIIAVGVIGVVIGQVRDSWARDAYAEYVRETRSAAAYGWGANEARAKAHDDRAKQLRDRWGSRWVGLGLAVPPRD